MTQQVVGVDDLSRCRLDDRHDPFAPVGVGQPDDRRFVHLGPLGDHPFDLGGIHVEAAGDDHVREAADDREVSLRIERAEVAGAVPAVDPRRRRGRLVVEIAIHHEVGTDARSHRPRPARRRHRRRSTVRMSQKRVGRPQLTIRTSGTNCTVDEVLVGSHGGDVHRGLGLAVVLGDDRSERGDRPLQQLDRHRRGADRHASQARRVGRPGCRVGEHTVEHRRREHHRGDAVSLDRGEHGARLELGQHDGGATRGHHAEAHPARDVGQWGGGEEDRIGVVEQFDVVAGDRRQRAIAVADPLGDAGGASGCEHGAQILAVRFGERGPLVVGGGPLERVTGWRRLVGRRGRRSR